MWSNDDDDEAREHARWRARNTVQTPASVQEIQVLANRLVEEYLSSPEKIEEILNGIADTKKCHDFSGLLYSAVNQYRHTAQTMALRTFLRIEMYDDAIKQAMRDMGADSGT